ncbi:MAG: 7-cyano-7-deazaguanine synthase QueC [Betaproteobacteria bacterium]|jgi:7-cyano-7-deazaguanine synthase|nr:7-cyano-7-deazaguanine synthase QueC [Betaproteobacteria bacterium]NBY18081.1 7-cyano-7-deazaguanine synthase QueC [Betaproteobacteria bacterium]
MNQHPGALVLFSGGQDSATCLAWALDRFERVETIGFDYGQRHRIELECRTRVLQSLRERFPAWDAKLGEDRVLDLAVLGEISSSALTSQRAIEFDANGLPNTFVPGRNLLFFTLAGALAYRRGLSVLVGGMCETDYSGYPDCRDDTLKAQQVTLSLGLNARVVIETPLMWLDKAATWAMTERLGGDALVELIRLETHSCYLGDRSRLHAWGYGCGDCPACSLRKAGWDRYRPSNARPSHPIHHFALANIKPEPWKNGDGVTRTLATDRRVDTTIAAADSDWNWRISVADIETSAPFSTFEQVDRTLILLHGGPLILNRSGAPITLTDAGERISFEGEEAVDAQIAATTVQALNLMTRRGQVRSTVRVIHGAPLADPAQDSRASRPPDHHWASLTTAATLAFVALVVTGSYRIEWSADDPAAKQSLILRAGEGVVLREESGIGLVSALEIEVDTPSLRSDSAVGSKPWLILITLESSTDSSATIAH